MSRISLTEAYNNRDVIAWLTRQQSSIDEIRAFCQFLIDNLPDPNEFVLTIGDVTISGTKTFLESIVAQDGMDLTGLLKVTGTLQVDGDIVQNGSSYDTHAEQLYTTKDNVIMRDGAVSALSAGDTSGFVIKKYDGNNDMNLGVDANGVARLGDSGNELPFLLRDEAADLIDGAPLIWDAINLKAISGSGGGGDWELHTSTDWSDFIEADGGSGIKFTKDAIFYISDTTANKWVSVCLKGYGRSNGIFTLPTPIMRNAGYAYSTDTVAQARYYTITQANISNNYITANENTRKLSIDFVNQTATITSNTTTTNIQKSTYVTVYTRG